MSRQYFDDPYGPSRRRVTIQSHQPSDSSSRRNVPSSSRDFTFQSSFQPNRDRNPPPPPPQHHYRGEYSHSDGYPNSASSSSNRMNNSSNDRPHRRYRLEAPSTHSYIRHPQSYHDDDDQDLSRSSDRHYFKSEQPSSNNSSASQPYRYNQDDPRYKRNSSQYDRRHHREETYPSQSYPLQSNHRSVDVPSGRQHSNPVRSLDPPSSSSHTLPMHRSSHPPVPLVSEPPVPVQLHHPASLLAHFLQGFFGGHSPSFDDDNDDHSHLAPIDLIAFAWMMQRPDGHTVPAAFHIQFGDLFDLLAHDETSSVGLSESDIERIPTMTYRKRSKSKSTDDKCAICLSEYKTGETVKRLRCKHFFHPECIDPWLKTSIQCPICRAAQTD